MADSSDFSILPAGEKDVKGIGQAHLASWLQTYPNEELGIDKPWILKEVGFLIEKQGNDFRLKTVREARKPVSNTLYMVVKNKKGHVCGFMHITRGEKKATFDAIYLTKEVQGTGIADELMRLCLEFVQGLPITLEVADYNARAIRYYERHGFSKNPRSKAPKMFHDKIPIITMKRPADKEING
jgi:ribosomal protein S18 acetylase RimI-like enzyme